MDAKVKVIGQIKLTREDRMRKTLLGLSFFFFIFSLFFAFNSFAQEGTDPTYRDSLVIKDAVLIKDKTNLRAGPSTKESIIGKAKGEEKYILLSKEEKWSKIVFEDTTAWVYNRLIESELKDTTVIKVEVPPPPPPPPPKTSEWIKKNLIFLIPAIILIICLVLILRVVLRT